MVYALEVIASVYGGPLASAHQGIAAPRRGPRHFASSVRTRPWMRSTWQSYEWSSTRWKTRTRRMRSSNRRYSTFISSPRTRSGMNSVVSGLPSCRGFAPYQVCQAGMERRIRRADRAHLRQADPVLQPGRDGGTAAGLQRHQRQPGLVSHFVMASDVQDVFNFGGDLSLVRAAGARPRPGFAEAVCAPLRRSRLVAGERRADRRAHDRAGPGRHLGRRPRVGSPPPQRHLRARRAGRVSRGPLQSVPWHGGLEPDDPTRQASPSPTT